MKRTAFLGASGAALAGAGLRSPWNRRLVWSDEFEYDGLPDPAKWNYDVGGGGWGKDELEYYTDARLANASVGGGKLQITARQRRRRRFVGWPLGVDAAAFPRTLSIDYVRVYG